MNTLLAIVRLLAAVMVTGTVLMVLYLLWIAFDEVVDVLAGYCPRLFSAPAPPTSVDDERAVTLRRLMGDR